MIGDPGEEPWDGRMFCNRCGCPRKEVGCCHECGSPEYSLLPDSLYEGWMRRQKREDRHGEEMSVRPADDAL